jgi:hypothetical protein
VPAGLDTVRKVIRGLILPGQRRLHMKDESNPRRRSIASAITVAGVQATIYDAGRRYPTESERRAACLRALVADAARRGDTMLVLEQDDTLLASGRSRGRLRRSPLRAPNGGRRASARTARRDRLVLGQRRRLATTHRTHRHRRSRGLNPTHKREARAPRSSGRVSGSLPAATATSKASICGPELSCHQDARLPSRKIIPSADRGAIPRPVTSRKIRKTTRFVPLLSRPPVGWFVSALAVKSKCCQRPRSEELVHKYTLVRSRLVR